MQTSVHIIPSSNQGSSTAVQLKKEHPDIKQVYFRKTTLCYHSGTTLLAIPSIHFSSRVCVLAVEFSNPQGKKGSTDRMFATFKNHIRLYLIEGHDVTTAHEMREAIISYSGVQGVQVAVVEAIKERPSEKSKIL